ncbi:hypothetical protein GCM10025868_05680 [Angustibacter aerolatus]|uniref:Carbohydrate kinase PfkB domain-containing protein n=1 Tax=Angustibacter aerolatus TaxID=1162965 RepID=A0ABQ6JAW8_9ACTN|nr:hypothetical protein GCM10025868_05680 [Angustibacter aerolatus]
MAEAEVLVDTDVPEVAAARLTQGYQHVVLKLGAQGARWIRASDNATVHVPACPPPGPVVDTTGAGDAFVAALLATLFANEGAGDVVAVSEQEARDALSRACEVAALVTTRVSTRP